MDDDKRKLDIIREIDVLKVIKATRDTIKYCFEKCVLPTDDYEATSLDCNE